MSTTTYANYCENCEISNRTVAYCNVCQSSFCDECWAGQFAHKRGKVSHGGVPHEKTRPAIAEKVRNALEPPADDTVRQRLFADDQSTTWFGIERPVDQSTPIFQDYGRFADLMASTDPKKVAASTIFVGSTDVGRDTRTPSLVSFVGQTGAGKSTLIKLMVDLGSDMNSSYEFQTPVIGGRGAHVPTSEDVHLYIDPRTWDGQAPILFADCEGLEGGEREPLGALLKRKLKNDKSSGDDNAGGRFQKAAKIISERELLWAQSNKAGREFAVTNLYPRLLFTFSDVIVFVLKNPRVVEHVFERLVNWANAAIETSVNQPLLPHAIIVLNASENDIDAKMWDVNINTSTILDDLAKTVNQNAVFKQYADTWRQRGKTVDTLEQLVLCYYSSVQILRIPEEGRPRLIEDQVGKLYHGILTASIAAQSNKAMLRMLLDVEDLQAYLEHAFSHFSGTLDFPFDFVQASFINSPIPPDFGGNILKLAINIMDVWKGEADGASIFQALSYMVASCIMIETTRNNKPGAADQVFPQYLEHIDAALENFCVQHWPCEFVLPGTNTRCVNVFSGHGKDHQSKDGKIIAAGNFESSFEYARYLNEFRDSVYNHLWHLQEDLKAKLSYRKEDASQIAATIHRDKVVQVFYRRVSNGASVLDEFDSHTVCLCCLFEAPEHPLPCGHVLCTPCVKLYGFSHGPNEIEMYNCPLEGNTVRHSWTIRLKPKSAGVRILTLDGGGMRGIVELEILRALEQAMNIQIPIQSFFDLIVGTSTGGLITLGLGVMNWFVDECISQFESMVTKAFTRRAGSALWGIGFFVDNFNHSRYETKPLEQCLKEAYSEDQYLFGGRRQIGALNAGSTVKVAVTATSLNGRSAIVLGNYNRVCSDKLSYQFLRPEKKSAELKIWQAARATSAAPKFFKPYNHDPTQRSYIDGAVFHNNPIEVAEKERKLLWPELQDSYPDIVLSLGTATSPSLKRAESVQIAQRGMVNHAAALLRIAKNHLATSIECDRIWEKYLDNLPRNIKQSRFVRINPELAGEIPSLDDVKAMPELQKNVRNRLKHDSMIRSLAFQLLATSFYFEHLGPIAEKEGVAWVAEGKSLVRSKSFADWMKGRIVCRLQNPRDIFQLGRFFQQRRHENPTHLRFVIKEQDKVARREHLVEITNNIIYRMTNQGSFEIPIAIDISGRLAVSEIWLSMSQERVFPISGFPRCLFDDERQGNCKAYNVADGAVLLTYMKHRAKPSLRIQIVGLAIHSEVKLHVALGRLQAWTKCGQKFQCQISPSQESSRSSSATGEIPIVLIRVLKQFLRRGMDRDSFLEARSELSYSLSGSGRSKMPKWKLCPTLLAMIWMCIG
jgi:patatin-like phospholipase/acyl hydrolase